MSTEENIKEEEKEVQNQENSTVETKEETAEKAVVEPTPEELIQAEKDKYLRLFAEFENYKKRTSKERMELYRTAGQDIMVALLPILDDFDRGLAEIKKVKDSKGAIEQRMALIEQLQASRNVAPIVFDELAKLVPAGVIFESMTRSGNKIEIEGTSDSNNRLSEFMRALDTSKIFFAAELSTIKSDSSTARAISQFTLTFSIAPNIAPLENTDKGAK